MTPNECIMYAMVDPEGNIMDQTVVKTKKKCIYNGAIWGRCGDDRTWEDFQKEGYSVTKVRVIPVSTHKEKIVGKCKSKQCCDQYKREGITKNCIGCGSLKQEN